MEMLFDPMTFFVTAIITLFIFVGLSIFWIWMIVDCAVNEPDNDNNKIIWILIIIFTHIIGASIYFLVRRQQRILETGR